MNEINITDIEEFLIERCKPSNNNSLNLNELEYTLNKCIHPFGKVKKINQKGFDMEIEVTFNSLQDLIEFNYMLGD